MNGTLARFIDCFLVVICTCLYINLFAVIADVCALILKIHELLVGVLYNHDDDDDDGKFMPGLQSKCT